jgi:hypothetical protein
MEVGVREVCAGGAGGAGGAGMWWCVGGVCGVLVSVGGVWRFLTFWAMRNFGE